jgi:Activator of Hsp90 ATPase homolog 1-like protein
MTTLNFDIYLRATPEQAWPLITSPGSLPSERFGMSLPTGWETSHQLACEPAEDETDPGRRTCEWLQTEHLAANGGHSSVVSFELTAMGGVTRLSVVHRHLAAGSSYLKVVAPGWPMLLSSLKSLVETGEPLEFRAIA